MPDSKEFRRQKKQKRLSRDSFGRAELSFPPRLFGWGSDGFPWEFEIFVRGRRRPSRAARRRKTTGRNVNKFSKDGVIRVALGLLREVQQKKALHPKKSLKLDKHVADLAYMLFAYCAANKVPAPPILLWLLFEAFGLSEGKPSPATMKLILPDNDFPAEGVENFERFARAARMDGEADKAGLELPVQDLAEKAGAARSTIREWRKRKDYQRFREGVDGHPARAAARASWEKVIARMLVKATRAPRDGDHRARDRQ